MTYAMVEMKIRREWQLSGEMPARSLPLDRGPASIYSQGTDNERKNTNFPRELSPMGDMDRM